MNASLKNILPTATAAVLGVLLIWQGHTVSSLKLQLKDKDLIIQAQDTTAKSCTAALGRVSLATKALSDATAVAYGQADKALQAAQDRAPAAAQERTRLLSVRAPEGQDCQVARGLAQAAWEEGQ